MIWSFSWLNMLRKETPDTRSSRCKNKEKKNKRDNNKKMREIKRDWRSRKDLGKIERK